MSPQVGLRLEGPCSSWSVLMQMHPALCSSYPRQISPSTSPELNTSHVSYPRHQMAFLGGSAP